MRRVAFAALLGLAVLAPLVAEAQPTWDRQAVYATREAQLKKTIDARPADAQPLVDLAAFYLKPVAARDVEAADGVRRRVMVPLRNEWVVEAHRGDGRCLWVFRGDPDLARPLLQGGVEINAKHPQAIRESAMLLKMKSISTGCALYMGSRRSGAIRWIWTCAVLFDHRTAARVLNDQACRSPHAAKLGGAARRRPLSRDAQPEPGGLCAKRTSWTSKRRAPAGRPSSRWTTSRAS